MAFSPTNPDELRRLQQRAAAAANRTSSQQPVQLDLSPAKASSRDDAYQRLAEEPDVAGAASSTRQGIVTPAGIVELDTSGQCTLRWHDSLRSGDGSSSAGRRLAPGSMNLYKWPAGYVGADLALLRSVMLHLAERRLLDRFDQAGAFPIHALLLANSPEALALVVGVAGVDPSLLTQTHSSSGPFDGEGCLHILCANRQQDVACMLLDLAISRLSFGQLCGLITTEARGAFFEAPPMRWYGETPLSYACVFGCRELVGK